jgi:hypothetical protein
MAIVATYGINSVLSALIKQYDTPETPELFNEVVTINTAAATTIPLFTVLGKVTATGKYVPAVNTATDGSNVAAAIYIGNGFGTIVGMTTVAGADTTALVLARGKVVVAKAALVLDATYDTDAKKTAVYNALKAVTIFPEYTV